LYIGKNNIAHSCQLSVVTHFEMLSMSQGVAHERIGLQILSFWNVLSMLSVTPERILSFLATLAIHPLLKSLT
jgi:hypothetical protein